MYAARWPLSHSPRFGEAPAEAGAVVEARARAAVVDGATLASLPERAARRVGVVDVDESDDGVAERVAVAVGVVGASVDVVGEAAGV